MAMAVQQIHPVAHLPLVLGVLRRLEVATVIDRLIPPHPAHVLSCGRGVEALVLAMLDGDHALYKVGRRLEERGMVALLQPGLTRASLNDYRLGHILDALFAANLNKVFSALALKALEIYAIPTPFAADGLLYVAHDGGVTRVDLSSGGTTPVLSTHDVDLAHRPGHVLRLAPPPDRLRARRRSRRRARQDRSSGSSDRASASRRGRRSPL
jgi:hypothetical protein